MVCSFLGEYRGEGRVLGGKNGFGFGFLSGCREFSSGGQFGDNRRSCWDKTGSTPDDSIDGAILLGTGNVFTLGLPIVVGKEVLVGDSVHINVSWGFNRGSSEVGFVAFGISGEREEEFL